MSADVLKHPPISVVMNTLNAAATLDLALRSVVAWADEIVVVDMCSDDDTRAIAASYGARVVEHARIGAVDPARDSSVALAANRWVFVLDADEVVPASVVPVLQRIAAQDEADVVVLPWGNHVFGERCWHGTFGPTVDRHARFFKQGYIEPNAGVHSWPMAAAGARVLDLAPSEAHSILHFAYSDVSDFVLRADRYTTSEAQDNVGAGQRPPHARRALRQFVHGYVLHRGYRDGWTGLHTALALLFYRLLVIMKERQLRQHGDRERVLATYRSLAEEALQSPSGA